LAQALLTVVVLVQMEEILHLILLLWLPTVVAAALLTAGVAEQQLAVLWAVEMAEAVVRIVVLGAVGGARVVILARGAGVHVVIILAAQMVLVAAELGAAAVVVFPAQAAAE
jgi:hypothetical protein